MRKCFRTLLQIGIAGTTMGAALSARADSTTYNFNSDTVGTTPNSWYFTTDSWGNASTGWKVATDSVNAGNQALDQNNHGGFNTIATTLATPITSSWTVTFDYGWHWGDGNANYGVGISLRSPTETSNGQVNQATYNGYRYMIYMGDGVSGDVGKTSAARFQIESYNGNNIPTYNSNTLLSAGSDGSSDAGYFSDTDWGTSGTSEDTMNHGMLMWDAATGTLTAYYMPAGGSTWIQETQAMDLSTTSFSELAISYVGSGAWPAVDNIVVTVPEPVSCSVLSTGMGVLMLRRRSRRRGGLPL